MILVDSREAKTGKQLIEHLREQQTVESQFLQFGDYAFYGAEKDGQLPFIGVEVCTVPDLLGKIQTRRFGFQLTGCLAEYTHTMLLIIGPLTPTKQGTVLTHGFHSKMPFKLVHTALLSAKLHGIVVENVPTTQQGAHTILNYYDYFQKAEHNLFEGAQQRRPDITSKQEEEAVQMLMAGVYGLGKARAVALLHHFGTMQAAANADVASLTLTPGWGKKTAQRLHDAVRKEFKA